MSISTTATKDSYAGNNSNLTPYPITFKYFDSDHVTVYADGVEVSSGGLDYCTFAGDGSTGTGEFTTSAIYAPTVTITVVLDVPFDQPVVLQETGSLPAKTIEVEGFDRLNMQVRRVWRKIGDVLTFSSDEGGTGSTGTADNLLGFDGSGDIAEIPNTTFLQQDNNLSELANAPDQAAAQTNLNVDPAGTDNSTPVTKTGAGTYISLEGQVLTVDEITEGDLNASINASLDKADTSVQVVNNLSDVDAATARTNLGVDAANTDNSTDVTKVGTGTYVSLDTGTQVLTVDPIETSDINGFEAAVTANASVAANTAKISATAANVKAGVEGASITDAGTPAPTDQFLYRDAISGDLQSADFADFGAAATDGDAIHKSSASEISALTDKPTPVIGDFLVIEDSAAGNVKKSITLGNLPLPAAGTVTEAMLNTTTNDSLDKADTALQSIAPDSITYDMLVDSSANKLLGSIGAGTVEEIACTSAGRDLLDDANASAQRTTLGLAIGSDVQAHSSTLDDIVTLPSVTGTASFTNSSNNINLAGIGSLGGTTEVGDVIQVTGSTGNNKLFTVDEVTDANNVIVNKLHKGITASALEGNKALATENTGTQTITLYCKAKNAPVGLGQGWVAVSLADRLKDTDYTNTTNRTLAVAIVGQGDPITTQQLLVDGVQLCLSQSSQAQTSGGYTAVYGSVPDGSVYKSKSSAAAWGVFSWNELR